ncbi:MAG: PQQ-binding-like beta-propeller repeat protein [Nitrososphaerota archaeon]|jgi:outer membrane protein assembly factor BamB|nr:PQQ-binding-like beta-propeller repeat protein [Nitrososphaerota archaeon]
MLNKTPNQTQSKKQLYTTTLLILLVLSLFAVLTPIIIADDRYNHTTYIHTVAAPNPQLVGSIVYITYIIANVPPSVYPTNNPRYFWWSGITLSITYPDGSIKNITNLETSYAGSGTQVFVAEIPGNYSVIASFAGETIPSGPSAGINYGPSTSKAATFEITDDPSKITSNIVYPLPDEYWTFPIEAQNKQWYIYAGGWLAGRFAEAGVQNAYNPHTQGPYSSHVMWSKPWTIGGLVGGENFDEQYQFGRWPGGSDQYFSPYISNGIMYVNLPQYYTTSTGGTQRAGFVAIDLATNEELWRQTAYNNSISYLQRFSFSRSTMATGTTELLWDMATTTWRTFDPLTGNLVQTINGAVSGGRTVAGPSGELLVYYINGAGGWLACWNSTYFECAIAQSAGYTNSWIYDPNTVYVVSQGTWNFSLGYMWNITIPKISGLRFSGALPNDMLICTASISPTNTSEPLNQLIAIDIKPDQYKQAPYNIRGLGAIQSTTGDQEAKILWGPLNITVFSDGGTYAGRIETAGYTDEKLPVFVIYTHQTLTIDIYSGLTGKKIATTEPFDNAFAIFAGASNNLQIGDGKLFSCGYDGTLSCFNLTTGKLIWDYYVGDAGENTPYGTWPIGGSYSYYTITADTVYIGANEHSPSNPTWQGGKIWAVNSTDGTLLWKIDSIQTETQPMAAYGNQLIYLNYYDGKIYDIGRGPSATTVSALQTQITPGETVTLTGTVMDVSPGTKQTEQVSRFPNGLPCISDNNMDDWMNYVYMQKPRPKDLSGVTVTLSVIDANNNERIIGTAISDGYGFFSCNWTPDIEGKYTLFATFAGSQSYYPSQAVSAFHVAAPQPTTAITIPEPSMADLYFIPAVAGILIVNIIIGILLAMLLLKKRS